MRFAHRHFIIAVFIFSFLISLLLLRGPIEDFFAYYYIGRSIVFGQDMFADVAHNKGPVTYLFFAALYWLFGLRYDAALVFSSTMLDAAFCIGLIVLFTEWIGYTVPKQKIRQWVLALCCVAYVKSFSIGSIMGSVYTEQLAMTFIVSSLVLVEKKRVLLAGTLFALAVLTRQSVIWYGFVFFVRLCMAKQEKRAIQKFLFGCMLPAVIFVFYLWWRGVFSYAWENLVVSVMEYRQADTKNIVTALYVQTRIFFSILFTGIVFLGYRRKVYADKMSLLVLSLLAASVLTVSRVMIWGHQFLQWIPLFLLSFFWMQSRRLWNRVLQLLSVCIAVFVFASYGIYVLAGAQLAGSPYYTLPMMPEISEKKYLLLLTPYEKAYIDFQKESPDRYFVPYLWFNRWYFGDWTDLAISRHKRLSPDRVRDTAFVVLSSISGTGKGYEWYFDEFGNQFKLSQKTTYRIGDMRMEIYSTSE